MLAFTQTKRGRFTCNYCDHKSYKTMHGVLTHVDTEHREKLEIDVLKDKLKRAEAKPPQIIEKEKIVYKTKPEPKYWYVKEYGFAGIFCTSCKQVQLNVGIPVGQTIENTPHQCGNRTLLPVVEVK